MAQKATADDGAQVQTPDAKYAGRVALITGEEVAHISQVEVGDLVAEKRGEGSQARVTEVLDGEVPKVIGRTKSGGIRTFNLYKNGDEFDDDAARFGLPGSGAVSAEEGDRHRVFKLVTVEEVDD